MRIGVLIRNIGSPEAGGGFTFKENIIQSLSTVVSGHDIFVFHAGSSIESDSDQILYVSLDSYLEGRPWYKRFPGPVRRIARGTQKLGRYVLGRSTSSSPSALERAARDHNISVLWFPTPEYVETSLPYFTTVWDLGHRVIPMFPEVRRTGWTWEARESRYSTTLRKAAYIVTGTEVGKKQIQRYYQVDPSRIKVNPFPTPSFALKAGPVESIPLKLPEQFLFYPAQFWPHKNHILILNALEQLRVQGRHLPVIFTGSDKGNQSYIQQVARQKGIADLVHCPGFVSQKTLTYLYQNALALVFVTFLGPDNLPPLEAFALGCPVIASDIPGAEEQLGDAALLVNPTSASSLVEALQRLSEKPEERERLVRQGRRRAAQWNSEQYVSRIMDLFTECEPYRRCWDWADEYEHL